MPAKNHKSQRKVITSALRHRYLTGLAVGLPVFGLFSLLAFLSPAHYRAQSKIKITPSSLDQNPQAANILPDIEEDITLLKSKPLLSETLNQLTQEGVPLTQSSPESIQRSLSIRGEGTSQSIEIYFDDPRANNAASLINKHIEVFKQNKLRNKRSVHLQVRKQIDDRIPQAKTSLNSIQKALQEFNQKYQLQTATNSSSSAAAAYNQAQQELLLLQEQGKEIDSRRSKLFEQLGVNEKEAKILAAVSQSKEFQKLIKDLRQLENKVKRKQAQLTPQHPEMVDLRRDITDLRQGLNTEIQRVTGNQSVKLNLLLAKETKRIITTELGELEAQRAQIISRTQVLQKSLGTIKQNVVNLPKIERQNQALERQLTQAQANLDGLLKQKKDIDQALAANVSEVPVITPAAVPTQKIAPYKLPLFVMGGVTSLLMAGLAMWISEIRDRSLKTVEDAEDFLGLKVLGVIPHFEAPTQSLLYDGDLQRDIPTVFSVDQPGSSISEAFRMLYLNLKVIPKADSFHSVAITSSIPQEGKSTIAANLAAVIAQSGKSVLLVDGNLNHPFQSLIWNLPNDIGLSNILFSQTSFLLAVKPISNNLDVLTSGSIRNLDRNPYESKQMRLFIADMSSRYDCVIFDLPAVNVSADASIIGQLVDGVIFVSKPGKLDELNAMKAQTLLQRSKATLLGMILNGSDDPKDTFLTPEVDELDDDIDEEFEDLDLSEAGLLESNDFSNLGLNKLEGHDEVTLAHAFGQESLPELEAHLETLQSQWAASKRLLDNKEEELIHLCHAKKDLEQQLNDMSLSLSETEGRDKKLENLNSQIIQTESRRKFLNKTIKSLREQLTHEQENFYAHLKILQTRHSNSEISESLMDDHPKV